MNRAVREEQPCFLSPTPSNDSPSRLSMGSPLAKHPRSVAEVGKSTIRIWHDYFNFLLRIWGRCPAAGRDRGGRSYFSSVTVTLGILPKKLLISSNNSATVSW